MSTLEKMEPANIYNQSQHMNLVDTVDVFFQIELLHLWRPTKYSMNVTGRREIDEDFPRHLTHFAELFPVTLPIFTKSKLAGPSR